MIASKIPKNTLKSCLVIAMSFTTSGYAASATPVVTGSDALAKVLDNIETALKTTATDSSSNLTGLGLEILGVLFLLNFVWMIVKGMATGRMLDSFLADILPVGVGTAAAWVLISGANGQVGLDIISATENTMNAISSKLSTAGSTPSGSLGQIVAGSIGQTLSVILNLTDMKSASSGAGMWSAFTGSAITEILNFLVKLLVVIGAGFFLLLSMGIFIANLVVTQLTLTIAVIFMPIFVPFLIFKPLSGFFDTWLKFFITAWFMKIIGLLMLTLTQVIMTTMVATSEELFKSSNDPATAITFNIVQYGSIILMAAVNAYMMMKAPSLAGGLVGGSGVGFSGWGELNRGMMSQGPMGGMGKKPTNVGEGGKAMGSKANALSGLSQAMPNAVKPITNAAGSAASRFQGNMQARKDMAGKNKAFNGPMQPGRGAGGDLQRDISKMSPRAQQSYTSAVERANATQKEAGGSNFTIPNNGSTTSTKHPENRPENKANI